MSRVSAETLATWTDAMTRIQTAVMNIVNQDQLAPLDSILPIPRLAQYIVTELAQTSTNTNMGHISRILTIRQPWQQMTIIEYLQTLVHAPHTFDVAALLSAVNRQATTAEQDSLRRLIELWAVHELESAPRVGVPLEKLIIAIYNRNYDAGDEEVSDHDEDEEEQHEEETTL
jgi:hypothetical protein